MFTNINANRLDIHFYNLIICLINVIRCLMHGSSGYKKPEAKGLLLEAAQNNNIMVMKSWRPPVPKSFRPQAHCG